MTVRRLHLAVIGLLALSGCYQINPELRRRPIADAPCCDTDGGPRPYRFDCLEPCADQRRADETFVVLTLSGGGTRAAAFGFGAMQALRDTRLADGRRLLDEVDVISSVSGGSFAAAYYGLFGSARFFDEFPDAVLYRNLELGYGARVAAPWNWPWLLSPYYGRSDLAAAYYDRVIFAGKTFVDMPRRRPFVMLNATDIGRGAAFSFTQDNFDRICSDLDGVHVARAVTASSAFPVAFTPLTLKNYGGGACGYEPPGWVADAERDAETNPPLFDMARTWRSYDDAVRRPYIHLSDGGLADNIGLRGIESALLAPGELPGVSQRDAVQRLVVIAVDAKPRTDSCADRSARPPGIVTVLTATGTNPMENYSSDTVDRFRLLFEDLARTPRRGGLRYADCEAVARRRCDDAASGACARREEAVCREVLRAGCEERAPDLWPQECQAEPGLDPQQCYRERCDITLTAPRPRTPEVYLIHLRFDSIPDEDAKETLQQVDTRLSLPREHVDLLVLWGRRLLASSPEYQRLLESLGGAMID